MMPNPPILGTVPQVLATPSLLNGFLRRSVFGGLQAGVQESVQFLEGGVDEFDFPLRIDEVRRGDGGDVIFLAGLIVVSAA